MTLRARRRTHPPTLPAASVTDVLLRGWAGPIEDGEADFAVFELSEAALAAIWREYRTALLAEAAKRGITRVWAAEQFDA